MNLFLSAMKDTAVDILVVEDSEDDSEITEFAIKHVSSSIHSYHFANGVDALNFVFAQKSFEGYKIQPGLKFALLDLSLPTISGLEMLKKIRNNEATKNLPVIILTSSMNELDRHAAYDAGANSYVLKPGSYDDYVKKIESLAYYWCYVNEGDQNNL